jgi:hypothetical protein
LIIVFAFPCQPSGGWWHYSGNFWWATAGHLKRRSLLLDHKEDLVFDKRLDAEKFLLANITDEEADREHYCVHHPHHDL